MTARLGGSTGASTVSSAEPLTVLSGSTGLTALSASKGWSKDSPKSDDKAIGGKFRGVLILLHQRPRSLG